MPRLGVSWWHDRASSARRPRYPVCRGELEADVVVIGGGLTGAVAACVLARGGLDVVLVEAGRLAEGQTAAGLGCLVSDPAPSFVTTTAATGLRTAKAAWRVARTSARELAAAIRRLKIRCDLTATTLVTGAADLTQVTALRREQAARRAAGFEAPWLKPAQLHTLLGLDLAGGMRTDPAATFDPVLATFGFAKAAAAAGARIFESSPVRRTTFDRNRAEVRLADAVIRTSGVYVATGVPGSLFGQLRRHVREQEAFVVVTEPLETAMKRQTGRRTALFTEATAEPHWLRWLKGDRAMFAGAVGPVVPARQRERVLVQKTGQLMYELSLRYPVISGLPAATGWPLRIASAADGLPYIGMHRNYPFHYFALGLGWHGETFAWFAAKSALRRFSGRPERGDDLFGFGR